MIRICSQLAMKPQRANIRRILIAGAMGYKRLVDDAQRIFKRLGRRFANGEGIFAEAAFGLKSDVLHDNLIDQMAPVNGVRTASTAIVAWNGCRWAAKG